MGDAGVMGGASADILTVTTPQAVTGAKTFNNQKLLLRNPADTFTGTVQNPVLSSNANILLGSPSFKYIIYKSGTVYNLLNPLTQVIEATTSSIPETLFQTAISAGGDIYVADGIFTMSGSFAGLDFPVEPLYTNLVMNATAHIVVPNGYTGYVFKLINSSTQHCAKNIIRGGILEEAGSVAKLWTGIKLQGTGSNNKGVFSNHFYNTQINYPRYGIVLNVDSTATGASGAFINHNTFQNLSIYGAEVFIDFLMDPAYTVDSNGFHRNRFYDLLMQRTSTYTLYGVKNIRHKDNIFIGCYVADFAGSQITSNIHTDARGTIILGGTMTALNFTDTSTTVETAIFDIPYRAYFNRVTSGTLDLQPQADANSCTFSVWNTSRNTRFMLQKSTITSTYAIKSIKQASGALLPITFGMQDIPGATDLESFRINADTGVQFSQYNDDKAITAPANPATGFTRRYAKVVDSNNDGLFVKRKINGAVVEVQL